MDLSIFFLFRIFVFFFRLPTCSSSLAGLGWESLLIFSQFEFPKQTISLLLKPNYCYISPLPQCKPKPGIHIGTPNQSNSSTFSHLLRNCVLCKCKLLFSKKRYILTTQKLEFHVWISQRNMGCMLTEDGVEKCHLKCNKSGWRNFAWLKIAKTGEKMKMKRSFWNCQAFSNLVSDPGRACYQKNDLL